jgi:hypothetical protein
MLFFNGKQYLEGIDSIDLMIQPSLYRFLRLDKQLDPYNKISLYSKNATFQGLSTGLANKHYIYLHISGEYINPELPIKDTIANAISALFQKGILYLYGRKGEILNELNRNTIRDKLNLFVTGISGIEFCFDFIPENVHISDYAKIIDVKDVSFQEFKQKKQKERPRILVKCGTTYYSFDYTPQRNSILKMYNRKIHLLQKNNEYKASFINNNPYIIRIEFVLKRNKNTSYLTLNNLDGNYYQVINKFIPYLAKIYKKYFIDIIVNNTFNYPNFYRIYTLAHSDALRSNKLLENTSRIKTTKRNDSSYYNELVSLLQKEKREKINLLNKNIPDSFYFYCMNFSKLHGITPFDIHDDDKILFKDDDFIFMKDQWCYPKYKTINESN